MSTAPIGFDTTWNRIKDKYPKSPFTSSYISGAELPPVSEKIQKFVKSQEELSEQLNVAADAWVSKPSEERLITQIPEHEVIGGKGFVSKLSQESLEKTKNITKTFMKKMENYPRYLSHEGSTVLCVLLSLNSKAVANLNNLPQVDVDLIKSVSPYWPSGPMFEVEFDESKDFILKFDNNNPYTLSMFNSVIHARPEDAVMTSVQVEKNGDKIAVGGKIHLDKRDVKRLIGVEPLKRNAKTSDQEEEYTRRQPVAGRNAYEIRADVLALATEFMIRNNYDGTEKSAEEVLELAKKFYSFVEKR